MTLPNRVRPTGEIVADPWRGRLMGNRGCLHDPQGRLGTARWRTRAWVCCLIAFRGRHRPPMPPGRYTALFFTDEAVALAAGHRPCGECRRPAYQAFRRAWAGAGLPGPTLAVADRHLHAARVGRDRRQIRHRAPVRDLPDGVFVIRGDLPSLIWRGLLWPWEHGAYRAPVALPGSEITVLTPAPVVATIAAGYAPDVRPDG